MFADLILKNEMSPDYEKYSELIKKQQSEGNGFSIIKWIQLRGFLEGRTTALKKVCDFQLHRYLYVTRTFKISLFSWSWAEQRENKKKHTHMCFYY